MTVARLGYEIDSSGAVKAAGDLDDMSAAAKRAEVAANKVGAASKQAGGYVRGAGAQTAYFTSQLNDIGMMMAAGQNPLQLALQQGSQVSEGFQRMGLSGRDAVKMLASSFTSMINPMSLMTLGVIAGTAALTQWAFSAAGAEDDARSLDDVLGDLASAVDDYKDAVSEAKRSTSELAKEYGIASKELKLVLGDFAILAKLDAHKNIDESTRALNDFVTGMGFMQRAFGDTTELSKTMRFLTGSVNTLDRQAVSLSRTFSANLDILENSADQGERLKAALDLREALLQAAGGHAGLNEEQEKFLRSLGTIIQEMEILRGAQNDATGAAGEWADAMAGVRMEIDAIGASLSSIGGGVMENAAKAAELQALRAGKSIREAAVEGVRLRKETEFAARESGANFFERLLIQGERYQFERGLQLDAELDQERAAARERERAASGARGGGGASDAELTRLIQSLQTEREVLEIWYAEQQMALQMASDQELAIIGGKNEAKLRLEQEYQERLAGIRQAGNQWGVEAALSGGAEILGAMGAHNEKALKMQAVFAAGAALISTYQGAAKELEKGTFGFASAAAVIAKGIAFVGAIKSAGSGSASTTPSGSGSSAGITATGSQQPQQTRAIISLKGGRSRFTVEELDDIVQQIQDKSDDGVIIEGFGRA